MGRGNPFARLPRDAAVERHVKETIIHVEQALEAVKQPLRPNQEG